VPEVEQIADAILVDAAVASSGDAEALLGAVQDFADWATSVALLLPGEFPVGALFIANMNFYVGQVENGGHWQFAGNSRMRQDILLRIVNVLHSVGAEDYRLIFSEFLDVMSSDPDFVPAALAGDYARLPAAIKALDTRFFALDVDGLFEKAAAWVRSLPRFKPVPAEAMADAKAAIIARHGRFAERQAAAKAAQEYAEAADPKHVAAKRLCAIAGLTFQGFNAGRYVDGRKTIRWGMRTDKGVYHLTVGPLRAELRHKDTGAVLAAMTFDAA
jgi:hypothetical protein